MRNRPLWSALIALSFCALIVLSGPARATDLMNPTRIVVLPFYVEEGDDARGGGFEARHYRRMMKFINNQLVRHGFEVVNPFAHELKESEYNDFMSRAREDSVLAAREVTRKYATDVAYIVWLDVKRRTTSDGYCKVQARLEGEGYDSGGRDLGVGLIKTFKITRRDCDDAIVEAEKEVGDVVGRTLTAWSGRRSSSTVASAAPPSSAVSTGIVTGRDSGRTSGALQRRADALESLINVRLEGATQYELVEVFGKVLNTVRGVSEVKTYRVRVEPDNPQGSIAIWRARIQDTEPFRVQANALKMINEISDAGGTILLEGIEYRYSAGEVDLLKGIRPGDTSSREIQFVVDRELARDREFSGRHDPYAGAGLRGDPGFD